MVQANEIKNGIQVLCKDGNLVGIVDHMETDGKTIKLKRDTTGAHHWYSLDGIQSVDVKGAHLKTSADAAKKAMQASAPRSAPAM